MNYPTDKKGRYVRIPTALGREHKAINLITIHKKSIEREKKKLGISNYGLLWISFFRGVILTIIVERVLFH